MKKTLYNGRIIASDIKHPCFRYLIRPVLPVSQVVKILLTFMEASEEESGRFSGRQNCRSRQMAPEVRAACVGERSRLGLVS